MLNSETDAETGKADVPIAQSSLPGSCPVKEWELCITELSMKLMNGKFIYGWLYVSMKELSMKELSI